MSASTSANMRRTTCPLPCSSTVMTAAPEPRATAGVPSVELLSKTWTVASGSAARNAATTSPIVAASL